VIVVKYNNVSRHEACALCQADIKAPNGPALFKEGTWEPVCAECAEKHAPELALMVKAWHSGLSTAVTPRCDKLRYGRHRGWALREELKT